jgi:hypothetical protein
MLIPLLLAAAVGNAAPAPGLVHHDSSSIVLKQLSADPLTNSSSMHAAEVGSVVGTNGNTEVSEFLVGRNYGDGAPAMGFATFSNSGFTSGLLPSLTEYENPAGSYSATAFPSVAWDVARGVWIVSALGITGDPGGSDQTHSPVVFRSTDGVHWSSPQQVAPDTSRSEKNLLTCDNNFFTSPHFGACYIVWDDNGNNDLFHANVSTDGGQTWGPTTAPPDSHSEYGAMPVVQPNGNVVVTAEDYSGYGDGAANLISFVSNNGGTSWSPAYEIAALQTHTVAANMRTQALPSSGVNAYGTVYTVWQDCRFRSGCSSNDIVLSTSNNGTSWTAPARIPLDSTTSGVDHFLPSLSVSSSWWGTTLALTYYYFPQANCTLATCALDAAYTSSSDGGRDWAAPVQIAGPMNLSWLPLTAAGYMVGDYFGTALSGNGLYAPIAVATVPGSQFNEAIYLPVSCQQRCDQRGGSLGISAGGTVHMELGRLLQARHAAVTHKAHLRGIL